MARGRLKRNNKGQRKYKNGLKHKPQAKAKKLLYHRDPKYTKKLIPCNLKYENERQKETNEPEVKCSREKMQQTQNFEDPLVLLMSSFKKNNKLPHNVVMDSSEGVTEINNLLNSNNTLKESYESKSRLPSLCESNEEKKGNVEENTGIELDKISLASESSIEGETHNKTDPFHHHLNLELRESMLESLSGVFLRTKTYELHWPALGKLRVEIPTIAETSDTCNFVSPMEDAVEYAGEYEPPELIENIDWNKLHVKTQIQSTIFEANKYHAKVSNCKDLTQLQKELFSIINNYQDLIYCERSIQNCEEVRFTYCLHVVNHILKTRMKIWHHNYKLSKKIYEQIPDEFRDQGLVRPKVILLVPFRHSCLSIVNMICSILLPKDKGNVINKTRFYDEFSGSELIMPKRNPKPEDYEQLFKGNIDDNFKIGLSFTRKSIRLYSDFYSSDIIIASPLGLRMVIGAEGDKERDFDFLSSIELLILDQAEVFLMQNWDHLLLIFEHLHVQPKQSHGTDFSRVRSWALNGWTKFYRQTLIFSSVTLSELNSVFNRQCFNYAGKVKLLNTVENGTISQVIVPLSHVFHKFQADSASNSLDSRFHFFTSKIIPQFSDPMTSGVLIYVPSYFDFVRIRNYLKKENFNFVQICEYSKDAKIARARDMFFHNEVRFLLYSERFHFFRRITLKGIRHVIFYQLPVIPHFYSEICNLMQECNQNRFLQNDSVMTITTLYCKYDTHQLSAVVKTSRAAKMMSSDKNVHLFTTG